MSTELEVPQTLHIEPEQPQEAPAEEGQRPLSAREQMMARIAAAAEEVRGKEIAQGAEYDRIAHERGEALPSAHTDEPEVEAEPEQEAPAVDAPSEPPPATAVAPAPAPAQPAAPQLRYVNLNGQQVGVTDEQFAQLAQMGALAGMALTQQPTMPPQPQPVAPPSFAVDNDRVRETVQRIQFGSPDEGTAALASLIQDVVGRVPQAPAIDQQALVTQATQRAMAEMQAQQVHATVRTEFPEIFKDQGLMALAQQRVQQISQNALAHGQRMNDLDIYREAGKQVYDLLKLPRPGSEISQSPAPQAAPTVQPRADIVERKRAAPRNPQPVDRRSAVPEAPRAPTPSEIVRAMQVQRGQAPLN